MRWIFLSLLTLSLTSCADGKLAWDQKEEKKEEKKDEDPNAIEGGFWDAGYSEMDASPVELSKVYDAVAKCVSTEPGSIYSKVKDKFFEGEAPKLRVDFGLKRVKNTNKTLIFFSMSATSVRGKELESKETLKTLEIANSGVFAGEMGKIKLHFVDNEISEALLLRSHSAFPIVGFNETLRAPELDDYGNAMEETRLVRGVGIHLPKGYSPLMNFDRILPDNSAVRVKLTYDLNVFRNCVSSKLRN